MFGNFNDFLRRNFFDGIARDARLGIAQGLRGQPVLAEIALQVAAQHAEGEGVAAGQKMGKGFLLDRVGLYARHIPVGDAKFSTLVDAYLADATMSRSDLAMVGTSHAFQTVVFGGLEQFAGNGQPVEGFLEFSHKDLFLNKNNNTLTIQLITLFTMYQSYERMNEVMVSDPANATSLNQVN